MKFQINSKELADAIAVVRRAQQAKNALPILDSVLFSVRGGVLTLMCSDSELYLIGRLPLIESDGDFDVAVQSGDLAILKTIADQPVTVECSPYASGEGIACTISYLNGQVVSHAEPGAEFPHPYGPDDGAASMRLPLAHVFDGIRHTRFAAHEDATLYPQMCGVYFDLQPYGLVTVASDGGRLAKAWYKDIHTDEPFGFVVPSKAVKILCDVFSRCRDEEVELLYSDRDFCVRAGIYSLHGRFAEGRFPNYNSVIPPSSEATATISRQDMSAALSRVGIFADFNNRVVLQFSGGSLAIESRDDTFARSARENVACEYSGQPLARAVDYRFLSEILQVMQSEESVSVHISANDRWPLTLTPAVQPEGQDILYLLMPMAPAGQP